MPPLDAQDEREVLAVARAAIQRGYMAQARQIINSVLKDNPRSVTAWSWACQAAADRTERIHCLQQILVIDPSHAAARRYLAQLQSESAASSTPVGQTSRGTATENTPTQKNPPGPGFADWLLMPLGCLMQIPATFVIGAMLVLLLGGALVYYTTNTSFFGLAAPDFEGLAVSPSYEQVKADDLYWHIIYEKAEDTQFPGLVRHVSPIRDGRLRILTHDILVTSGQFSDPSMVRTSVFNHRFRWRSPNTAQPSGTINLLHTVPANQDIYRQLLEIREQDEVIISGREILKIEAYNSDGNYLGEWHDTGCNTLLVNSVTKVQE
jgi:hypothetical protein